MKKSRAAVFGVVAGGVIGWMMFAPSSVKAEPTIHEKCERVAEMAEFAMIYRQSGLPMGGLMKDLEDGVFQKQYPSGNPERVDYVMELLIKDAYQYPKANHVSNGRIILDGFVSSWTVICYNSEEQK